MKIKKCILPKKNQRSICVFVTIIIIIVIFLFYTILIKIQNSVIAKKNRKIKTSTLLNTVFRRELRSDVQKNKQNQNNKKKKTTTKSSVSGIRVACTVCA